MNDTCLDCGFPMEGHTGACSYAAGRQDSESDAERMKYTHFDAYQQTKMRALLKRAAEDLRMSEDFGRHKRRDDLAEEIYQFLGEGT